MTTQAFRALVNCVVVAAFTLVWPCSLHSTAAAPGEQAAQSAGAVKASGSAYRLIRSISGSKGTQKAGRFVIEDPRSIFYVPRDKQVVVYLEWEGQPGFHRFEAFWKNPEGKPVVLADLEDKSQDRTFGVYFTLLINESMQPGQWALEVRINGEAAGAHTFQVIAAEPGPGALPIPRPLLAPADIYRRGQAASVFIEKLDAAGRKISTGSGFFTANGAILTAFHVVDGASSLRILFPDGRTFEVRELLAWDRRRDYAFLKVALGSSEILPRAKDGLWSVGERCFALDVQTEGGRVIREGAIVGRQELPHVGTRLNVALSVTREAAGSPLLNEYGEVIGIVGVQRFPGEMVTGGLIRLTRVVGMGDLMTEPLVLPLNFVPLADLGKSATLFSELFQKGEFLPQLSAARVVQFVTLNKVVSKSDPIITSVPTNEFTRSDEQIRLGVFWQPTEQRKSSANLKIYDLDNQLLFEAKPATIELRPGKSPTTSWTIGIKSVPKGYYRIDVLLGEEVVYRTFFRITE
jgi:S1-C subfamily serine protease